MNGSSSQGQEEPVPRLSMCPEWVPVVGRSLLFLLIDIVYINNIIVLSLVVHVHPSLCELVLISVHVLIT